jgi:hypothetical protein
VTAPVPPDPAAAIALELAHLREAFVQVGRDLAEVKTSTAVLVERSTRAATDLDAFRQDTTRDLTDHESRLRALEKAVWRASGVAAVVGAGVGVAASLLGH